MTNDVQTMVRLPSAVVRRIDALARRLTKTHGIKVTRAGIVRRMIVEALAARKSKED